MSQGINSSSGNFSTSSKQLAKETKKVAYDKTVVSNLSEFELENFKSFRTSLPDSDAARLLRNNLPGLGSFWEDDPSRSYAIRNPLNLLIKQKDLDNLDELLEARKLESELDIKILEEIYTLLEGTELSESIQQIVSSTNQEITGVRENLSNLRIFFT